jgi:hypothetical protein
MHQIEILETEKNLILIMVETEPLWTKRKIIFSAKEIKQKNLL